ncbi:MAG: DUF2974 domain-containing protein [Spirochaetaceae bacterium]|jgi:hypothetical protein|nr:DUF2974 domain-containing protein [Spirochaetaceae bacterium]
MSSLFDYLEWRGDLPFENVPFNPVDNILFSILVYYPWEGIVGGTDDAKTITIREAARLLLGALAGKRKKLNMTIIFKDNLLKFLETVKDLPRYADTAMCAFADHFDKDAEKQFSAVTFIPEKGAVPYIAFRGTDDSIVGWKEDFNMSFTDSIPAQLEAVGYLEAAARRFNGAFHAGGHSKGGNLAVYAAAHCPEKVRNRIITVYNNDGPGISSATAAKPGYAEIAPRILTFIPQTSIVGLLFEHKDDYTVVKSNERGFMQHSPFSWAVKRDAFHCLEAVSPESRYINQTLTDWLAGMDNKRRRQFIDALFAIFKETGVSNFSDLTADWLKSATKILKAVHHYDKETKEMLLSTFASLLGIAGSGVKSMLRKSVENANRKLRK